MSKPYIHSVSSAKKFGGVPEDYLDIHNLMDSSKSAMADVRHRTLTHNAWFIGDVVEKVYGSVRTNSDGKVYSVRDIAEQHVLEDYGMRFIPTVQDFLALIPVQDWMNNGKGEGPPSIKLLHPERDKVNID